MKRPLIISILLIVFLIKTSGSLGATIKLVFYTNLIELSYTESLIVSHNPSKNSINSAEYYYKIDKPSNKPFIDSLLMLKSKLSLNDWLFYKLIEQTGNAIYPQKSAQYKTLFCWYVLNKCGFDAILAYGKDLYLYVYTKDKPYLMLQVYAYKKPYVCISHRIKGDDNVRKLSGYSEQKNSKGAFFSFSYTSLPVLANSKLSTRKISFYSSLMRQRQEIEYLINETYLDVLKDYPFTSFKNRFEIPVSNELRKSLLPQLQKIVESKDTISALRVLMSFARSAAEYKADEENYGEDICFNAEEALYHPYLDCEDYSSILYFLNKELLNLPSIVLIYPDRLHLNLGVSVNKEFTNHFQYKENKYIICDATGPGDFQELGENKDFREWRYIIDNGYNTVTAPGNTSLRKQ